ncbi:MAG: NUDIX domain-containing protein [candidate division KSB1 bacterium]|nr:NUDIX domain-containing protein [candidate division KSB1 bacterium]
MKVKIKQVERLLDDFFKIDKAVLQYERFDGTMTDDLIRLNFNRGNSVAILLYKPETESVILVYQFRYPAYVADPNKGWLLEIVAGSMESGPDAIETPEEVARKELLEEIGYQVDKLDYVCEFFVSPGGTSEKIFLYFAEVSEKDRVKKGGGLEREGEDILLKEINWHQAWEMIQTGEICDAKTIIGLQWLKNKLVGVPPSGSQITD